MQGRSKKVKPALGLGLDHIAVGDNVSTIAMVGGRGTGALLKFTRTGDMQTAPMGATISPLKLLGDYDEEGYMEQVTPEHCAWLEHLSDGNLRSLIDQLSNNPYVARWDYIEGLRVLLADRIGRRAFWTGRGNSQPAPLS